MLAAAILKNTLNSYIKTMYGAESAEAWGMRSAEGKKVNVLEMKCLRSLVGVSQID